MAWNQQHGSYGGYQQAQATPVQAVPVMAQPVGQPVQGIVGPVMGRPVTSSPYVVPAADVRVLPTAGPAHAAQDNRVQASQVPSSFPQLAELSEDELAYMHDNSIAFDDWLSDLPAVRDLSKKAEETYEKNKQHAQALLNRREELNELRRKRDQVRQAVEQKRKAVEPLQAERTKIANRHAPEQVLEQLAQMTREAEAAADKEQEEFIFGSGGDYEAFKRRYLEHKTAAHRKTAIHERVLHSMPRK